MSAWLWSWSTILLFPAPLSCYFQPLSWNTHHWPNNPNILHFLGIISLAWNCHLTICLKCYTFFMTPFKYLFLHSANLTPVAYVSELCFSFKCLCNNFYGTYQIRLFTIATFIHIITFIWLQTEHLLNFVSQSNGILHKSNKWMRVVWRSSWK